MCGCVVCVPTGVRTCAHTGLRARCHVHACAGLCAHTRVCRGACPHVSGCRRRAVGQRGGPQRGPLSPLAPAGTLRVELLSPGSLDPLRYDDGPYEAGGEKDQDPSLIPVPANSYFGTGAAEPGHGGARHRGPPPRSGVPPRPRRPAPAHPRPRRPPDAPLSFSPARARRRAALCDKR